MQYKQSHPISAVADVLKTCLILLLLTPLASYTQTTYLPQDARESIFLERLEIKLQNDSVLNFSRLKPYSRLHLQKAMESPNVQQYLQSADALTSFNYRQALVKNVEVAPDTFASASIRPIFKHFYKTPANLLEVKSKDFFLVLNPVLQLTAGKEREQDDPMFLNTRGISLRGSIANKIGFSATVTENQERDPMYVREFVSERRAVPGAGFYQQFKQNGYDYFDARGYFTFGITKYIQAQFGYDKNFIGNGVRSLYLSDFSAPNLFLKLNTRIWKLNYQNLFMELNSANRLNVDQYFPKKYAAMHHLDLAVTKWLNIGLFEAIVFGRENRFEFSYLNPVIFLRSMEQQSGSFDNALVGFDAKANVAKRFQLYGQILVDEFSLKELRKGTGWWGNKVGYQAGAKYIDALNISHLDLQVETSRVRPFTYSHSDSVANYTHYNQPLAHPLGANFYEWIGLARYQPAKRWLLQGRLFYYLQGKDTGSISYGGNIFLPNTPLYRKSDFGYEIGSGIQSKTVYGSLLISFEVRPNLFFELNTILRKQNATVITAEKNNFIWNAGIRWNIHRRDFEF